MYDVIIIGAGPIGLASGIEAEKAGLNYLIIEKGCLVNSLFNYPTNMTFFSTSELLEIGGVPFVSHNPKPTRAESLEYYRRVQQDWELRVHQYERVEQLHANSENAYELITDKSSYLAHSVIVATGFYDVPRMMNVPGEQLPKVKHYYDDPHLYAGRKVLVVGAANSAVDAALETYRKGAEVTMAVRGSEISSRVKYWVKPDIDNRIKEGAIKAYFDTEVVEIKETSVVLATPEGQIDLENDHVLAMTGYLPDFSFLKRIGIDTESDKAKTPTYNNCTHESNMPHIYLAGVVCGGLQTTKWYIENSRQHPVDIVQDICKQLGRQVLK
jgi:putative YpdA family bacillithiol system oxidoreductase